MKINQLETMQSGNADVDRLQSNLTTYSLQLADNPFLKGRFLTVTNSNNTETINIPLTNTAKKFSHKLGKAPLGYIITFQDADAVIYSAALPTEGSEFKDFITFQSSANVTVNIWVF